MKKNIFVQNQTTYTEISIADGFGGGDDSTGGGIGITVDPTWGDIAERTAQVHVAHVCSKLGVENAVGVAQIIASLRARGVLQ